MKIQKDDLYYSRDSLAVILLNRLKEKEESLRKQADRIRDLNIALTNYIQEGKITDTDEMNCAIGWLYHSNLSISEILDKTLDKERN